MAEQFPVDMVAGVHLHAIKSCHESTVDGQVGTRYEVGPTGFEVYSVRDRDYVLVDEALWMQVTQRGREDEMVSRAVKHPEDRRLATVQVDIRRDHLAISTPGFGQMELATAQREGKAREVDIFGKPFFGIDQGEEPAVYFSRVLGRAVRLLRSNREQPRMMSDHKQREGATNQMAGADGAPFLLVNRASLAASHERNGFAPGTVPINRFRGNIEIEGAIGAYNEDFIRKARIGEMVVFFVGACPRCPIPNVDQETGVFNPQAGLKVLRGRAGESRGKPGIFFGQNLVHIGEPGQTISVGDKVRVLEQADERNVILAGEK